MRNHINYANSEGSATRTCRNEKKKTSKNELDQNKNNAKHKILGMK